MRVLSLTLLSLVAAGALWAECSQCQSADPVSPAALTTISKDNLALSGVWVSNCYGVEQTLFSQDTYTFSATGSFSLEVNRFADRQCSSYKGGSNFYGSYQVGEQVDTMGGEKARKVRMSIDNADWPEGVASQVDWLLQLEQDTLRFGAFNPPFNWINNNVVFQKLKGQGPMVF
jgi:hypothetical protein